MLPKTMITYLSAQAIADDAVANYENREANQLAHAAATETAADPKSTMSSTALTDDWVLPAGKYLVEVQLNWVNAAAASAELEAALTNEVTGSAPTVYGQTSTAWVTPASIGDGTAFLTFVAHVTAREPEIQLRVANTLAGGAANVTITAGSFVRFTKISNKYDS